MLGHAAAITQVRSGLSIFGTQVVQEIKSLRSAVQQREKERAERATLVQQERLVRSKVCPA